MTTFDYQQLKSGAFGAGGGGKGGGGAARVAQEDPNSLQSNSLARVVNLISYGPCRGLIDGAKSVFLDGTPLQASNGSYNFTGIDYIERTGEADQSYIEGFASASTTTSINVEVTKVTPVIRTLAGPLDACAVTVGIPYLTSQSTSTGDLLKTEVSFTLSKRVFGTSTWTNARTVTYNDKCVSTFNETFRIPLGGSTDWDIKFTRNTADSEETSLQNKTNWAYTTLITDNKFIYPTCGLVATSIDAKQFGSSIPTVSFRWGGVLLPLPSNYDPETRTYTGIWDGTFTTGWSNNPAWVLYGVLTDKDYGLGNDVDADQVDKYALYEIAQYCDEYVDDGFGGSEPRYVFNYQFNRRMDAYTMVQLIAATFRGLTYWLSGKVAFTVDMPSDSVKIYNEANVVGGFTYEGVGLSARHSVVLVTWFDLDNQCKPVVELVDDADLLETYGWREVSLVAYGCTSRGQAHRVGKWLLDTEKHATETVNFEASWDSMGVVPGDIITVYDENYAGVRLGGRITASTTTSITIDVQVSISAGGQPYSLAIINPDGTVSTRTLTNATGDATILTFTEALEEVPVDGAVWGLSSSEVAGREFRILAVRESENDLYAVSGLFYDPSKYDRVEEDVVLDEVNYSLYNKDAPAAPIGVDFAEYAYRYSLALKSGVTLTWTPAEGSEALVRGYELELQREEGDWLKAGEVEGTTVDIKNVDSGLHYVRVRAIGFIGITSEWFTKEITLFGIAAAPAAVSNFRMYVLGDSSTATWEANTELDLSHYVIKYSVLTTGAVWASATTLMPRIEGTSVQLPTSAGSFLIKAVDISGTESDEATLVVNEISPQTMMNSVAAVSDWPTWAGTFVEFVKEGTDIKLAGLGAGSYTFAAYYDLGEVYTSRVSSAIDAVAGLASGVWEAMDLWSTLGKWSATDSTEWGAYVELRTTNDDPSSSPTWSDWSTLVVGDYEARAFEFRFVAENYIEDLVLTISDVTVTIDMPDRLISAAGTVSSTGGTAVSFSPAYKVLSGVAITGQNLATGDYFVYSSGPAVSGFTILWRDSMGIAVSRTFDYIATGYGRVT